MKQFFIDYFGYLVLGATVIVFGASWFFSRDKADITDLEDRI